MINNLTATMYGFVISNGVISKVSMQVTRPQTIITCKISKTVNSSHFKIYSLPQVKVRIAIYGVKMGKFKHTNAKRNNYNHMPTWKLEFNFSIKL